jgi:hypothetical protein
MSVRIVVGRPIVQKNTGKKTQNTKNIASAYEKLMKMNMT